MNAPTPVPSPVGLAALPPLEQQAERLFALGVLAMAGIGVDDLCTAVRGATPGLLAVRPERVPASQLVPLLTRHDRPGFVVVDMTDVDEFTPIHEAAPPACPVYVVTEVDRGDQMANWSPDEALPAIVAAERTPLTLTEGLHWLLQQPSALERNHCFMTIGSRRTTPRDRLDSRTPAIWISNGTGRDGRERRDAPKVGWCWAGNRHTWLGFASASGRRPLGPLT